MADTISTSPEQEITPQSNIDYQIPTNNFDPRPQAIDVYDKVVGNPLVGSNPGAKINPSQDSSNFIKASNDYTKSLFSSAPAVETKASDLMKPYTYNGDYDGANFARYYNSAPAKELGFNPYRDNESLYNNNMTTGDEFTRAASQWPSLISTGFMSGVRSWGTMFTDPLAPDVKGAEEMQRAMAIGSANRGGAGSFFINTALNSGYTIGIGAEMLVETLAIAGATAVTGGLDAEVTLPLWMTRMAGGAAKVTKGAELVSELKNMSKVGQFKSFWDANKYGKALGVVGKTLNPLEHTWEVGKDIAQGTNALKYADKAGGTINRFAQFSKNFGEFAKDMVLIKAGVSEAQLEAGMVQIDVTKDLISKYKEEHDGIEPTGIALAEIENLAKEEAHRTALWNLPAIMWSNKFMYETMFAPFEKTAKKGMANLAEDILFKEGKGFTAVKAGLVGKVQKLGAGIKTAEGWGKFGYNYLKMNAPEGIQENIQEAISSGAKSHALAKYNNPDRGAYEGYMSHFLNGAKSQFSAQGAETFAGGFVMGAMAQPFMAAPIWAGESVWNKTVNKGKHQEYQAQRATQLAQSEKVLNEFYKDPGKYFAPDMVNALVQGHLQKEFTNANMNNDRKTAEDAKSLSKFEHLYTALSTGKFDILMDKFKTFKDLDSKAAADAFHVADGAQALKMLDDVVERGQKLKSTYEDVSSSYPNPFDPLSYKKGTEEYFAQQNAHTAWEEAKKNLIFAKTEFENHSKRIEGLAETLIGKRNPIKNANAQDLLTLMDRNQIKYTINGLILDIKNTDATTPEGRKVIAEKTKRKEYLIALGSDFDTFSKVQDPSLGERTHAKKAIDKNIKQNFKGYINHIAGTTGDMVFDDQLEHALGLIRDNYNLRDERASLVSSINILNNPKGFLNLHRSIAEVNTEIEKNKNASIKAHLGQFANNKQMNNAINDLYKTAGVFLTKKYRDYLKETLDNDGVIELPKSYIDAETANFTEISDVANPKFVKAQTEWIRIAKAIQAEQPKVPVVPAVKPTTVITPGKLIYATTGSGKSTWIKDNPNQPFVDADVLLVAEIKKSVPEFKIIPGTTDNETLFQFAKEVPKEVREKIYETVRGQIEILKTKGQSVLTGSTALMKDSDLIYLQTNTQLLKDKGLSDNNIEDVRSREQAVLTQNNIDVYKVKTLDGYIGSKLNVPQTKEQIIKETNDKLSAITVNILKLPANSSFFNENGQEYAVVKTGATLEDTIIGIAPFGNEFSADNFVGDAYSSDPTSIIKEHNRKMNELFKSEKTEEEEEELPFEEIPEYNLLADKLVSKQKEEVIEIETNIKDQNKKLRFLQSQLNDRTIELVKRTEVLEDKIQLIKNNIDNKKGNLSYNKTKLKKLNSEYKILFSTANSLKTSIRAVKAEIEQLEEIRDDLLNSIQYYTDMIIANPRLTLTDIVNKKEVLEKKVTTIESLIKKLKEFINSSLKSLKDITSIIIDRFKLLNKFKGDNKYFVAIKDNDRINELISLEKQGIINEPGKLMLVNFAGLNEVHTILETDLADVLEHGDIVEEAIDKENIKLQELQSSLTKYLRQIRYLDEMIDFVSEDNKTAPVEPVAEEELPEKTIKPVKVKVKKPRTKKEKTPVAPEVVTEEPGIKTGTYPSDTLIKRGIRLGFTKEQIVDMSTNDREQIAKATSADDVKDLLAKVNKVKDPIPLVPYAIGKPNKYGISEVTFADSISGDPYSVVKENDNWVIRNEETGSAIIGSSKISPEDAIEKAMAELIKMNENFEKSNILKIVKDISKIKTFEGLNTFSDELEKTSLIKTNYIMDGLIQNALSERKEQLFKVINEENLIFAKEKGWNIKIGNGIYSTFTVNKKVVKVKSSSNIPLTEYSLSDIDEITKDKPTEPEMIAETKEQIKEVVNEGSDALSTETIKQSFNEVTALAAENVVKAQKDITDNFTKNLGCK